ncbi:MAG TPA: S8 family serine peptidase, partial [Acidobacteriota bacterium]|nr:S8 family serine peptidase [Acidobacteriota bacterium]
MNWPFSPVPPVPGPIDVRRTPIRRFAAVGSLLLLACLHFGGAPAASAAASDRGPEIVVKLEARAQLERGSDGAYRVGRPDVDRALNRIGAQAVAPVFPGGQGKNLEIRQRYGLDRYYKIRLRPGADARAAAAEMRKTRGVELATEGGAKTLNVESATGATAEVVPNDPSFNLQWALQNTGVDPGGALGIPLEADADIDATDAWGLTTGSANVTVGIVSSGIDFAEPELAGRFYENTAEATGVPGVDDDGNGYVDDVRGWDFIEGDNNPGHVPDNPLNPNQATLDTGSTRIASVLGANGNNAAGIAGVDWACRLLSTRVFSGSFFASTADIMAAYLYSAELGARVVISNILFFDLTPGELTLIIDTVAAAQAAGAVIVVPVGSTLDGSNTELYPAPLPGVLGVATSEGQDLHCDLARCGSWSVTGNQVAVTAPGRRIVGIDPVAGGGPGTTAYLNGGGIAASIVAGTVALAFAANPALTVGEASAIIRATADDLVGDPGEDTPGRDGYHGDGRVNAFRAVQAAAPRGARARRACRAAHAAPRASRARRCRGLDQAWLEREFTRLADELIDQREAPGFERGQASP